VEVEEIEDGAVGRRGGVVVGAFVFVEADFRGAFDEVAEEGDGEAMRLIAQASAAARAISAERRSKLVEVSEYLKKSETISGEQLDVLLGTDWTHFSMN